MRGILAEEGDGYTFGARPGGRRVSDTFGGSETSEYKRRTSNFQHRSKCLGCLHFDVRCSKLDVRCSRFLLHLALQTAEPVRTRGLLFGE
jgi:hypothetical protein